MGKIMSSREFNQNASKAQKVAEHTPVFITNRGRMAQVLLSYAEYQRLRGGPRTLLDAFSGADPAVAEIDLDSALPERDADTRKLPTF